MTYIESDSPEGSTGVKSVVYDCLVNNCVALAEDLAEHTKSDEKSEIKSPCHVAVDSETDDESQIFHSSRTLNRKSLSLVCEMNTLFCYSSFSCSIEFICYLLSAVFLVCAGCIQLLEILEIYLNLKTLLEILEISVNWSSWKFLCDMIDRIGCRS